MSTAQLVFKRYETKYLLDAGHPAYREKSHTRCYGTPHPLRSRARRAQEKCDGAVYKRRRGADHVRGGWDVPRVMGSLVYSSVDRAQVGGAAAGGPQGAGQPQQPSAAGGPAGFK